MGINRERNHISLTESGKIFLQYSERILILCEESCRALIDLKKGDRGNLKVGASQTIGTYLMPRILALFAQNYPQIDLKVQVDSTRSISNSIIKREIDIAIVGGEISKKLKKKLTIQPSLSKQIKILEENLDTILINRERNNISLTESGRVFLQYSNRILILCEESCRALIDLKKGDRGNLKVGA